MWKNHQRQPYDLVYYYLQDLRKPSESTENGFDLKVLQTNTNRKNIARGVSCDTNRKTQKKSYTKIHIKENQTP